MQSDAATLLLVAHARIADHQREAEAGRLANIATARVSVPRVDRRSWLASTLRAAVERVQRAVANLPIYAYR